MSRTCESCGRSWRGGATFCGACGDLLPDALSATVVRAPGQGGEPRRGVLAIALGIAVLAGAAAVPTLAIERTPPVTGEIGVPATDDLRSAPTRTSPRRQVPAPEITCSRDDTPLDCVLWSRDLLGPPTPDGEQGWPVAAGDEILLTGADGLEGVDAATGTRLWRSDGPGWPLDLDGEVALVETGGRGLAVIDLTTGTERWSTSADAGAIHGDVLHDGVVLLPQEGGRDPAIVARAAEDGAELWRWPSPWQPVQVLGGVEDRVLATPADGAPGLAIVDLRTGEEVATSDIRASWWMLGALDGTVVFAEPIEPDRGGGGNPAGDPGAVLRAVSLDDASVVWERPVPAGDVNFGLADGAVLAPSTDLLTAIDAATGEVTWERPLGPGERIGYHGPGGFFGRPDSSVLPDVVVTVQTGDGTVRGHDPRSGAVVWERTLVDAHVHDVGVTGDVVWVGLADGFALLEADTGGDQLRVHGLPHGPVFINPLVLFHHESGTVTRLALPGEVGR